MDAQKISTYWTHLHTLCTLARQGSFTATAHRLGVSKSAVSQRIAELEKAIGVALVQRTTRSVQLTEAGHQLAGNTSQAFDTIVNCFMTAQDMAEQPRGSLRVTAPVAFSRQHLVPRLTTFLRLYPNIRIELNLSDRLVTLEQEGFDLAIRHTDTPPDTYVAWQLCNTRSILVASPGYLQQHGEPRHPTALSHHVCLHYPRPRGTAIWRFAPAAACEGDSLQLHVPVDGALAANNSEALRDVALQGGGIALTPDFSVQQFLQRGDLVEVLPDWRPLGAFGAYIYALRPYSPHVPLALRLLVDYLQTAFKAGFSIPADKYQ